MEQRTASANLVPGPIAVVISAVGFGLSPYFATRAFNAGVDPAAASFIRIAILFVLLSPFARQLRGWRTESYIVAGAGAASMLGFAGYFVALERAPVAAATVVYYTYPVVVLALSAVLWKRRFRRWEAAVSATLLVGVVFAVGPVGMSGALLIALLPAAAAPIGWAIFLIVLSGPAAEMPVIPKIFAGACGGSAVLLPIAIWQTGGRLMPLTADAVVEVGLLTICTLAIPALFVTWGAPRVGGQATAMIGSLEFVIALAASWLLMGATIGPGQLAGILLVVGAATETARRQPRATADLTRRAAPSTGKAADSAGVVDVAGVSGN